MSKSSWQPWNNLILSESKNSVTVPCATHAAICGHDGLIWTVSENLNISPEFIQNVKILFDNKAPTDDVSKLEIEIEGEKESHYVLQVDPEETILGRRGTRGLTVAKGKTCYLIGVYDTDRNISAGNNKKRTLEVRDELSLNGI